MKIALVHEALTIYGGAEKVLEELSNMYPEAPIFVPLHDASAFPEPFRSRDVRSTWLDRVPFAKRNHRMLFPLYPNAMNGMDLSGYDLVISSSFNFAHNVATGPETCHLCYCHSPARFLWDYNGYAEREGFGKGKRMLVEAMLPFLRTMDRASAQGVDRWVSTSRLVRDRIRKVYRQPSDIVAPPVDVSTFATSDGDDGYYLLLMRLVPWKRADIAIEACRALGLRLVVAGEGRDMDRLKGIAGPGVEFVGRVDGKAKADLYSRCKAFILPTVEDFGITPLEAMASGKPVIALGQGGALDTVVPGVTGALFPEQTTASLVETLRTFQSGSFDPAAIRAHAETFDVGHFRQRMMRVIDDAMARHRDDMGKGDVTRLRHAPAA